MAQTCPFHNCRKSPKCNNIVSKLGHHVAHGQNSQEKGSKVWFWTILFSPKHTMTPHCAIVNSTTLAIAMGTFIANSGISKVSKTPFFKYCWQKTYQNTISLLIWCFSVLGIGVSFDSSHQTWWLKHFWWFYSVLKCCNWKKSKIWIRPSEEDCQKF